jgi:hypothetical protein
MPNFTDITGLASLAVATTASLVLLPGIARLPGLHQAVLQSTVFALMLIPFGDMPLAAYVRGVTGDLSITTLVMICCALSKHWLGCGTADTRACRALLLTVALAALALYPMAMGVSAFDPYRLGYGDPLFVAALLLVALAAWILKYHLIASCIAFAILAWTAGWYESGNLWDYLLDPWIAIYALFVIARHGAGMLMQRSRL